MKEMSRTLKILPIILGISIVTALIILIINSGDVIQTFEHLYDTNDQFQQVLPFIIILFGIIIAGVSYLVISFFNTEIIGNELDVKEENPIPELIAQQKTLISQHMNQQIETAQRHATFHLTVWAGFKFGFGFALGTFVAGALITIFFGALLIHTFAFILSQGLPF